MSLLEHVKIIRLQIKEAKSYSNDRRLSISKGAFQPANSLNKSGKRLSIGSLPPSLIGAEPIGVR